MRERVGAMTGVVEGMPWMGTFHSIGAKILRRHAELVGLKPNFTILDADDQIRLLKQILQAENIDDKRWPARALASQIDGWKNRGLDPAHVPPGEAGAFAGGRGGALYARLSGAAERAQRRRFRRPAARKPAPLSRARGDSRAVSEPLALHSRRRISGHQRRAISVAAAASRRRIAISAASATTTSRSTAGAAPTSTTSFASSTIFPAPRSSASSAITARAAISSRSPRG